MSLMKDQVVTIVDKGIDKTNLSKS